MCKPLVPVLSREQQQLHDLCLACGVIEKYRTVMLSINSRPPKDMENSFRQFIANMIPARVPTEIVNRYTSLFGSNLQFSKYFGIVLITQCGAPKSVFAMQEVKVAQSRDVWDPSWGKPKSTSRSRKVFTAAQATQDPKRLRFKPRFEGRLIR